MYDQGGDYTTRFILSWVLEVDWWFASPVMPNNYPTIRKTQWSIVCNKTAIIHNRLPLSSRNVLWGALCALRLQPLDILNTLNKILTDGETSCQTEKCAVRNIFVTHSERNTPVINSTRSIDGLIRDSYARTITLAFCGHLCRRSRWGDDASRSNLPEIYNERTQMHQQQKMVGNKSDPNGSAVHGLTLKVRFNKHQMTWFLRRRDVSPRRSQNQTEHAFG